jgi:hypothetical protein
MADMLRHSQCKILPCLAALISTAGKRANVATRCPVSHRACRPRLEMLAAVAPMRTAGNTVKLFVTASCWRCQLSWPPTAGDISCLQPRTAGHVSVVASHCWRCQLSRLPITGDFNVLMASPCLRSAVMAADRWRCRHCWVCQRSWPSTAYVSCHCRPLLEILNLSLPPTARDITCCGRTVLEMTDFTAATIGYLS